MVCTFFIGFVENGKHTSVEFVVIAVEILCHVLAKKPFLCKDAVRMLRDTPVELPSGIGTQFIVTGISGIRDTEGAMSLPILQAQHLPLHQITVLIEQFRIEHSADV